ncbi:hypothetical protein [uncultured Megasphaera sp.]|uniref:Secreted protein n=1 Tax=Megasphaera hominis TaxID=159836 RepID=A0ABR6VL18_9FIRM|nr:hypothetical protein [uncultured Megasphaera sp.]MBC3537985.1 hypothetical protein [Megasphaera hominis]
MLAGFLLISGVAVAATLISTDTERVQAVASASEKETPHEPAQPGTQGVFGRQAQ